MGFGEAIQSVFSQYTGFSGRARRSEYWYFVLFNAIVSAVLGALARRVGIFSVVSVIYALAVILPSLAVSIRRMHDTGRSGWCILLGLIPLVGCIIVLIFNCQDSVADNQYGPNPKG